MVYSTQKRVGSYPPNAYRVAGEEREAARNDPLLVTLAVDRSLGRNRTPTYLNIDRVSGENRRLTGGVQGFINEP